MIVARFYKSEDEEKWDEFCADAPMATFLHTKKFLSYHGERFEDASLVFEDDKGWVGILPAAFHPENRALVVSHPGITYGGMIHKGGLRGNAMIEAFNLAKEKYREIGVHNLIYKVIPNIYHQIPSQDDLYALFRLGAQRVRCDISSTLDLENQYLLSDRRRRSLKKAVSAGVSITTGSDYLSDLWRVLQENLARKHDTTPVHNMAEIELLFQRFPENIFFVAAKFNGLVEAGAVLFKTKSVLHAQYICSSEVGYKINALDAVFDFCIDLAKKNKARFFDFGTSNEKEGKILNEGLYKFKSEFGTGGIVHEYFIVDVK